MRADEFMRRVIANAMPFEEVHSSNYAAIVYEGLGVYTDGHRVLLRDVHELANALRGYATPAEWVVIEAAACIHVLRKGT